MTAPVLPEWYSTVGAIAAELDIPESQRSAYADQLADRFGAFSKFSPQLTPVAEVRDALAALRADAIAAEQARNNPRPDHISAGGEMICNVPKSVWEKLKASDRISIFRTWSANHKSPPGKPQSETELSDHTKRRLRSEIHGAELTLTRLRGAERTQQIQRLAELRNQLAEAGG